MRHILTATLLAASVMVMPAFAQDAKIAPKAAEDDIRCGVVFMLEGRTTGDDNWDARGVTMVARGNSMLDKAGFTHEEAQAVVDATRLIAGFSYGKADSAYSLEKCKVIENGKTAP